MEEPTEPCHPADGSNPATLGHRRRNAIRRMVIPISIAAVLCGAAAFMIHRALSDFEAAMDRRYGTAQQNAELRHQSDLQDLVTAEAQLQTRPESPGAARQVAMACIHLAENPGPSPKEDLRRWNQRAFDLLNGISGEKVRGRLPGDEEMLDRLREKLGK